MMPSTTPTRTVSRPRTKIGARGSEAKSRSETWESVAVMDSALLVMCVRLGYFVGCVSTGRLPPLSDGETANAIFATPARFSKSST